MQSLNKEMDMPQVEPFNIDNNALKIAKENKAIEFHRIGQLYNDCDHQKFFKTVKMSTGCVVHSDFTFLNSTMYLYDSDVLKNENGNFFKYRMVLKYSDNVSFDFKTYHLDLGLFRKDPKKYIISNCRGEKCRKSYNPYNDDEEHWCTACFGSPFDLTNLESFLRYTVKLDEFKKESILYFKQTFNVRKT